MIAHLIEIEIWVHKPQNSLVHGYKGESGLSFRFKPWATAEHDVPEAGRAY